MRRTIVQYAFFLTFVVLLTLAFVGLIWDFLLPLFWAAMLAIVFAPVCRWLQARLRTRASIAALLTLGVILVVVILPLSLIGVAVVQEATTLYKRLESGELQVQEPLQKLEHLLPRVTQYLAQWGIEIPNLTQSLAGTALTISRFVGAQALNLGQNALRFSVMFAVMLYVLFFFLRDGPKIVTAMLYTLPLGQARGRRLFAYFATAARATLKGTVVVALVQGFLGGVLFALVGINAAVLWGALMAVLSLLPALGSALVWLPAAGILFATGHPGKGFIVLGTGTLLIGLVDNLLRPLLIGQDIRVPDYLVLVSSLGGLTVLGASGLLIGPIVAAMFLAVWNIFAQEHRAESAVEVSDDHSSAGEASKA